MFLRVESILIVQSVYIAGSVLKKLLAAYSDKVDGQEAVANKKAEKIYTALEAHPDAYQIVPDKSARSRMNICFRVTKVRHPIFERDTCSVCPLTNRFAIGRRRRRS